MALIAEFHQPCAYMVYRREGQREVGVRRKICGTEKHCSSRVFVAILVALSALQ